MTKLVPKFLYITDLSIHKSSDSDVAAIRVRKTIVLKNTPKVLPSQHCVFCEKLCPAHHNKQGQAQDYDLVGTVATSVEVGSAFFLFLFFCSLSGVQMIVGLSFRFTCISFSVN